MSVRYDVDRTQLDPQFDSDTYDLLAGSPHAWIVTRGKASRDEQAKLYAAHLAGGPLAAAPGHSAHEWGLGLDVAQLGENGQPVWNEADPCWAWLWAACKVHPRLHSGHDFPPEAPADDDHIQALAWYAKKAELKAAGKW